ncbi:MAG: biotin/lipoyl-binding protein [Deltaproteobacteria bacterium]|nr:biotin/lipoyl-binding protein [Deltaproteobacteria bacterium]
MANEILAPLPGKIIEVKTQAGAVLSKDEEALTIEAMKMEMPLVAPCDGTVKEVRVKQGDAVQKDDVLVVME